jgi:adenosine deaminase
VDTVFDYWIKRLPKAEFHLHLEGAIPFHTLATLVEKYTGNSDLDQVRQRLKFGSNFEEFFTAWRWKNQFLTTYEDFSFVAAEVARHLRSQNVLYAEMFYSPVTFAHHGLEVGEITRSIRHGLDQVPEIRIGLVADLVHSEKANQGTKILHELAELKTELGVIGVGLGGTEDHELTALFEPVYEQARALGFYTTAHTGEAAGSKSIWSTIRKLKVHRIGHGTRAFEDPKLVDYLAQQQIPLEMSLISNLRTGVIRSLREHPVRNYYDRGIPITINSDDPLLFRNSLADEFRALYTIHGFSPAEIQKLILTSLQNAWLAPAEFQALSNKFVNDARWRIPPSLSTSPRSIGPRSKQRIQI